MYVRNRVDEIRSLLPNAEFVYVNTKENPSDLLSRGVSANMLENSSLWCEGSPWLKEKNLWPLEEMGLSFEDSDYNEVGINVAQVVDDLDNLMNWEMFSSFKKFVLTMAWVLRFVTNVKKPVSQKKLQRISLSEMEKATSHVLRLLQRGTFAEEYESLEKRDNKKHHLIDQLNLYLDTGLIRCKGLLEKADLPEETKFPLLLPKGHPVTLI